MLLQTWASPGTGSCPVPDLHVPLAGPAAGRLLTHRCLVGLPVPRHLTWQCEKAFLGYCPGQGSREPGGCTSY